MENKEIEFKVFYPDEPETHEKNAVLGWSFSPVPPVTVVSVTGHVEEERSELTITLSDETVIDFKSVYHIGPADGRKRDQATLTVDGEHEYEVTKEYMENLEEYGNNILAVLKTYEPYA
jgi:phosphotransferase system HPr-like phosphotransfer protein